MKRYALFLLLALPSLGLAATLTWDQAVTEAKEHNADLIQAGEALRQAQLNELGAKAAFLPKVNASANSSQGGSYDPQQGSLGTATGSVGLGLSGSLNLFNGFSNVAALAQARARRVQAEAALQEALASLGYSLKQSFSQLAYVQQQIALADTLAARSKDNADMVELRYEAGAENKGSLLQAQSMAAQFKFEAARARRQRRLASLGLSRLLGRRPEPDLEAVGSLEDPALGGEPDFEKAAAAVPSVRKAQAALDGAEGARLGAWSPYLPALNANASLNRSGPEWAPQNGSWSAGLSLSLNLFNGFADTLNLRSAASGLLVAQVGARQALDQARVDLETAWSSLLDAQAQVDLAQGSLKAMQARAEIARVQYAQGLMSFENWDQVETQLSNALKSELSSHLSAVTAAAAWTRALGKGIEP